MALVPIAGDIAGGIVPGKIASWLEYRAQWNRALKKPILCVGCSNTYLLRPGEGWWWCLTSIGQWASRNINETSSFCSHVTNSMMSFFFFFSQGHMDRLTKRKRSIYDFRKHGDYDLGANPSYDEMSPKMSRKFCIVRPYACKNTMLFL